MNVATFKGEKWSKASRQAAHEAAVAAKAEVQALRADLVTAKADIEKLKKGKSA